MKTFYLSDNYYDVEDYIPTRDIDDNEQEKKQDAAEFMSEVVKLLYSDAPIDKSELENCLDELCHYFNIKLDPRDLCIEKQQKKALKYA